MKRADLIRMTANQSGITIPQAEKVVSAFLESIALTLACGEPVILRRFGRFEPRHRRAVMKKNPVSGELMDIPAKNSVGFVPSTKLKDRLNGVRD